MSESANISRCTLYTAVAMLAIVAAGFAFRIPSLDLRPMHTDEAVHVAKAEILLEEGKYTYDPVEYHGPTIYYCAIPFVWLRGAHGIADTTEWTFRIVPVIFGTILIALAWFLRDAVGNRAVLIAAALTAFSPAMTFYSRYYIQEMLLVVFTFGTMAFLWRYVQSGHFGWALLSGACAGLMHATKETCIIAFAAMAGAFVGIFLWARWRDGYHVKFSRVFHKHDIAAAAVVALCVSAPLLSGFFTNPRGQIDAWLTYFNYLHRAGGEGIHEHPWYFYLKMLLYTKDSPGPWWSESLIMGLALVGGVTALARTHGPQPEPEAVRKMAVGRFFVFYTLLSIAAYSFIPYKTPWCALSFLHGMIVLAGIGASALIAFPKKWPVRAALWLLLALGIVQLGQQAYRANFVYCADNRNPYVYGHTSTDILRLAQRVEDIAHVAPEGHNMLIRVITPDAWPLPWYFRKFPRKGFWNTPPDDVDAAVVVTSSELEPEVQARLKDKYQIEYYGLRPEVLITVFIRQDLWDAFIQTRSANK